MELRAPSLLLSTCRVHKGFLIYLEKCISQKQSIPIQKLNIAPSPAPPGRVEAGSSKAFYSMPYSF